MQVSLKKAADYARSLATAASKVKFETEVEFSIYAPDVDKVSKVADVLLSAERGLRSSVDSAIQLHTAHYLLRNVIGAANGVHVAHESSINELMAQAKMLEGSLGILNKAFEKLGNSFPVAEEIIARLVAKKTAERNYGIDTVDVTVGAGIRSALEDQIASTRRGLAKVKEELTFRNYNTKVTLPEVVIAALREQKLVD